MIEFLKHIISFQRKVPRATVQMVLAVAILALSCGMSSGGPGGPGKGVGTSPPPSPNGKKQVPESTDQAAHQYLLEYLVLQRGLKPIILENEKFMTMTKAENAASRYFTAPSTYASLLPYGAGSVAKAALKRPMASNPSHSTTNNIRAP